MNINTCEKTGKIIRKRRHELGLTQEQASELFGVDQAAWSRMETKGAGLDSLTNLNAISTAFGIPLERLVFDISEEDLLRNYKKPALCKKICHDEERGMFCTGIPSHIGKTMSVLNPKGELFRTLKTPLEQRRYKVTALNLVENSDDGKRTAVNIAKLVLGKKTCRYWADAEERLLALVIGYVATSESGSVRGILEAMVNDKKRDKCIEKCHDEDIASAIRGLSSRKDIVDIATLAISRLQEEAPCR